MVLVSSLLSSFQSFHEDDDPKMFKVRVAEKWGGGGWAGQGVCALACFWAKQKGVANFVFPGFLSFMQCTCRWKIRWTCLSKITDLALGEGLLIDFISGRTIEVIKRLGACVRKAFVKIRTGRCFPTCLLVCVDVYYDGSVGNSYKKVEKMINEKDEKTRESASDEKQRLE